MAGDANISIIWADETRHLEATRIGRVGNSVQARAER
jgi:hypothetical protein